MVCILNMFFDETNTPIGWMMQWVAFVRDGAGSRRGFIV